MKAGLTVILSAAAFALGLWIPTQIAERPLMRVDAAPPIRPSADSAPLIFDNVGWLPPPPVLKIPTVIVKSTAAKKPPMRFFDFEHSFCEQVESVRGMVLRCHYEPTGL